MNTISFLFLVALAWIVRELAVGTHTWFLRKNMQKTYRHKNIIDPEITGSEKPTKIRIRTLRHPKHI